VVAGFDGVGLKKPPHTHLDCSCSTFGHSVCRAALVASAALVSYFSRTTLWYRPAATTTAAAVAGATLHILIFQTFCVLGEHRTCGYHCCLVHIPRQISASYLFFPKMYVTASTATQPPQLCPRGGDSLFTNEKWVSRDFALTQPIKRWQE